MSDETPPPFTAAQVIVDRKGLVLLWSECCETLFGYTAAEAIGRPVDFIIVPQYRDRHWHGFREAMERIDTDRPQGVGNISVLHADGSVHAHPFRQIILCDAFGRAIGATVIFSGPHDHNRPNGLRNVFLGALLD